MKPRITFLTLGVEDLERSLAFYRDGLGFPTKGIVGTEFEHGDVVFIDCEPGMKLALQSRDNLAYDATIPRMPPSPADFSIGHLVESQQAVDAVVEQARRAGAIIVKTPQKAFWGGYHAYFKDPDGHLWEVAWNPNAQRLSVRHAVTMGHAEKVPLENQTNQYDHRPNRIGCVGTKFDQGRKNVRMMEVQRMPESKTDESMRPEFRAMTPRFVVKDFDKAVDHYSKLGFEVRYRDEGFMILGRDSVEIQMNEDVDQKPANTRSICYMTVSGIEKIYEEIRAKIPVDPCSGRCYAVHKQPYGAKEFVLSDPFANLLFFSEPTD